MSEFITSEGCESPATTQAPAANDAHARLQSHLLRRLLTVYGLWVAVAVLYWPSAVALNGLWTGEETYTHGYLVLLISLWLIVRDRKRLAAAPVRPVPQALIALLLLSAAWVWAWRAALQEPHVMLLPLILFTAIVAALGWGVARVLAFPIGYLYFAMPMWSDINRYVQELSAKASDVLIWITGLPAYVRGVYVHLPGGAIEIANSCSGLHELIVGLALATLYGEITGAPLRRRLTWIGVMGVLSLVVNWVRIFIVLVAAYFSHMHSSLVRNHYWLGWWLFAGVFVLFLWWAERRPVTVPHERTRQDLPPEAASGRRFSLAQVVATLAVMAVLPALAYGRDWAHSSDSTAVEVTWPAAPAGWSGPERVSGGEWHPYFVRPGGESFARYVTPAGQSVEAFAVAYRVQTQNAKLLSYWNSLRGPVHQRPLRPKRVRIVDSPMGQWRETLVVDPAGARSLIWSRYRIGNRIFLQPRFSQLWYGLLALVLRPPMSSLIALRAVCRPDCRAARAILRNAAKLQPTLQLGTRQVGRKIKGREPTSVASRQTGLQLNSNPPDLRRKSRPHDTDKINSSRL